MMRSFTIERYDKTTRVDTDGRVWICINGMSFLRFKPHKDTAEVSTASAGQVD